MQTQNQIESGAKPELVSLESRPDPWLSVVLSRHRSPYWLSHAGPETDVVLSTRVRFMRNLRGFRFPGECEKSQLEEVDKRVSTELLSMGYEKHTLTSSAERALLLGSRLVSPEFQWGKPGRSLFLDRDLATAVMVNEEDHLRTQSVVPGFDEGSAATRAEGLEAELGGRLPFAWTERHGYLGSSLLQTGRGRRVGVMMHLPATVTEGRASTLVAAAEAAGLEVRGSYGESTAGLGAFVQLSASGNNSGNLSTHVRHLIDREQEARQRIRPSTLAEQLESTRSIIGQNNGLTITTAVTCLSWLRLEACLGAEASARREIDTLLALIGLREGESQSTGLRRSRLLRRFLGKPSQAEVPAR